jgi:hypothetical protein
MQLKRNRQEAFFIALKAMLVSPDFLYLREKKGDSETLNDFEIANRLSHFLWSSLPDNELFLLAKEKKLRNRDTIKKQVIRMLGDKRSQAFTEGFAQSWLRLDKLGTMPPASLKFREYYRYGLKDAMLQGNPPVRIACSQQQCTPVGFYTFRLQFPQPGPRKAL